MTAFLDDFTTDNTGTYAVNNWGGAPASHAGHFWSVGGGELTVGSTDGTAPPHAFMTFAATAFPFTDLTGLIVAVEVLGLVTDGTPAQVSVGVVHIGATDAPELVATLAGHTLFLTLDSAPATVGSFPMSVAVPESLPLWLGLVINGGDTFAGVWNADPMTGAAPLVSLPWDPSTPLGPDPTLALGTCVPQLGFLFDSVSENGNVYTLDNWEAGLATPGTPAITVTAEPNTIVADGRSQSHVTANVTDAAGHPVAGEAVVFTADSAITGAAGTCGTATDHGDGSYTAPYTSATVPGDVTITATDAALTATCVVHQTPTAVGDMAFGPPKHGIVRQGRS